MNDLFVIDIENFLLRPSRKNGYPNLFLGMKPSYNIICSRKQVEKLFPAAIIEEAEEKTGAYYNMEAIPEVKKIIDERKKKQIG